MRSRHIVYDEQFNMVLSIIKQNISIKDWISEIGELAIFFFNYIFGQSENILSV